MSNEEAKTKLDCGASVSPAGLGGRWERCSPELLQAGIDCKNTPRRPCKCGGGSHDHFISDDRLEITVLDGSGKRVQWGIGPTQSELLKAHTEGRCGAFCGYCIDEAEKAMPPAPGSAQTV